MSLSALAHQLIAALDPDRHIEAAAEAAGTDDPTVEQVGRRPGTDRPRRPATAGRQTRICERS